ncbi:MAG: DUF3494 domain-containing protein [Actinobacteria bacterium]|nr:DUF3494 domain-containing protein [Actinomycetota bacterium]
MGRPNDSGTATARTRDTRLRAVSIAAVLGMVAAVVLAGPYGTARAATQVDLGTAGSFAVLAGETITNTGPTTITGDVGLHPGSAVSGFDSVTLNGQRHIANDTARDAKIDLVTAYDNAAAQQPRTTVDTELGGETLFGGVYNSLDGTFFITGTLTLDAQNDPDTVWIFQTGSTLKTGVDSSVSLINGADACNVFWQVGSSATLDTRTSFAGNILALASVTLNTGATIRGRALARDGAVTMDTNTITRADCPSEPAPDPTPSPDASPTPDPTPSPDASPSPDATPTPSTSPSEVAAPIDSTPGPTGATTSPTTGAPDAPTAPDAPAAPDAPSGPTPPTSGTPQVPDVPSGGVPAGDGSVAMDRAPEGAAGVLLLLPALAGLVLFGARRRLGS